MVALGSAGVSFCLPDVDGKFVKLQDVQGIKGTLVMFICNHCPYVIHIRSTLIRKAKDWQGLGIGVVAINSNDVKNYPDDSPEQMKHYASQYEFSFPYLFDEDQKVARAYDAACTPDFFLYDENLSLVYRGQMDDSRPGNAALNDARDLDRAIERLLMGQIPLSDQKPSMGCNIKWKQLA